MKHVLDTNMFSLASIVSEDNVASLFMKTGNEWKQKIVGGVKVVKHSLKLRRCFNARYFQEHGEFSISLVAIQSLR